MATEKDFNAADQRCGRCGQPAAIKVGDEYFCETCYQIAGSCCLEFGGEDLWADDAPPEQKPRKGATQDQEDSLP